MNPFHVIRRLLSGKSDPPADSASSGLKPSDLGALEAIRVLFEGHGVHAERDGGLLRFPDFGHRLHAKFVRSGDSATQHVLQFDVVLLHANGMLICESCAGFGDSDEAARQHAMKMFVQNSFHVLLTAFFDHPAEDQVAEEEWLIGGLRYRAVIGNMIILGFDPWDGQADDQRVEWFRSVTDRIQQQHLPARLHWVRLFCGQFQSQVQATEALLDNETWPAIQRDLEKLNLPRFDEYYSVRVFLVLQPLEAG